MFHPVGRWSYLAMGWLIIKSIKKEILFALTLCIASAPLASSIAKEILPEILLPLLGISVSVFTAFRNTQAYNRWWEARILWGGLIVHSRNWRNGLLALLPNDEIKEQELINLLGLQVLLTWTTNKELRGSFHPSCANNVRDLYYQLGITNNNCSSQELMQILAAKLLDLSDRNRIDGFGRLHLLDIQRDTSNAIGGLERIRNQPLPAAYDLFIRCIVWAFGYLLFLRLDAMHEPTGALIGFISFIGFIIAERLGAFTESPFVDGIFGLPMNRICATISSNLLNADHPLATPPQNQSALIWT